MAGNQDPAFEQRLERLREEALLNGQVNGRGVDIAGGPIPRGGPAHSGKGKDGGKPGYYGLPVIKPPVWTWEVPIYLFIGGLSGMAAVIALAAWIGHRPDVTRAAMWLAFAGGIISPVLLVLDLGRPMRFLYMLRVFKHRSAMSMGVYILTVFGTCANPGAIVMEVYARHLFPPGILQTLVEILAVLLIVGAAFSGMLLATYTGVLLGATAIPAWFTHRVLLPIHFGTAGMGSAAASLILLGYRLPALAAISWVTAGIETLLWLWLLLRRHGDADRVLHEGRSGWLLQAAELLTGPIVVVFLALGWMPAASISFLLGAFTSRFGWVLAGRLSARDPMATFAAQR
jgi:formate-dependent nitrite reductase membrane component NrfD